MFNVVECLFSIPPLPCRALAEVLVGDSANLVRRAHHEREQYRAAAPPVELESKVRQRFIMFWLQAKKASTVNLESTWGQLALPYTPLHPLPCSLHPLPSSLHPLPSS
jgi:hypothetical protein